MQPANLFLSVVATATMLVAFTCSTHAQSGDGLPPGVIRLEWEPSVERGEALVQRYCFRCHSPYIHKLSTGPYLYNTDLKYTWDWMTQWIQNSSQMVMNGDSLAIQVWLANNKALMDPLPLTRREVGDIRAYIRWASEQADSLGLKPEEY